MNPDPLEQLLRDADRQTPVAANDNAELSGRVWRTSRRRRKVRITAIIVLVASILPGVILLLSNPSHLARNPETIAIPKPPTQVRVEPAGNPMSDEGLKEIQSEIALHEAIVARLLTAERLARANSRLEALAQLPTSDSVTERAAAAVVFQADRMLKTADLTEPALKAYTEVINYFPDTASADMARKRVAEINKEG